MSSRLALCFLSLGAVLLIKAVVSHSTLGLSAILLIYPGMSFLLLGIAYCTARPSLLGKRPDGRLPWIAKLLFGPYLSLSWLIWRLFVVSTSEPATADAAANLKFGRRLGSGELGLIESLDLTGCLDLTSEFTEPAVLRNLPHYRCLGLLDGTAPTASQLHDAVAWLRESTASGRVYVHCALGHGRTGTIMIAYLLATGEVASIDEGLKRLRSARPGVVLNLAQLVALKQFAMTPAESSGST